MKKSSLHKEQIIGVLKQIEGGRRDSGPVPGTWDQRGDVLRLQVEVRQ
jgi:hypothetical protein